MRIHNEHADCAWIIGIHEKQHDALFEETLLSSLYHIPDLTFEQRPRNSNQLGTEELHRIWNKLDSQKGALELLKGRGMHPEYPLYAIKQEGQNQRRRQTGLRNRWQMRACNLLEEYMEIPTDPGRGQEPAWRAFSIEKEQYEGTVYSLDVERWHHYISGGAIVHNCVYLCPDLSLAGMREYMVDPDPVVRMFYVGMTRARESLILCGAGSPYAVDLAQ